ncbi:putative baseplate assembly protein [Lysobacter yangpyeongensis]|uniref:Baseplate assembly protein n=1 Tax=Lysobacter yangpyeongensis TaxID=346182 RepID=A0ABW0SJ82_9GAMM
MSEQANDCGCCAGSARPPGVRFNAPGLPAIDYRIGRHGEFKAALLARVSSSRFPALAGLRTRENDDFTIAWCDAGAVMLDVLSFYQERMANEAYLRTSVERRSIVELARLIGYRPSPGVAASTHLAFTLEDAPGMPSLAAGPVTVPVGTRVQSIPGPDEQPQTFETVEPVLARVGWNAIPAQQSEAQTLPAGTRELFLAGVDTQLQPGDMLLLVGTERFDSSASKRWAVRPLLTVEADNDRRITRVTWDEALGANNLQWNSDKAVRVFALRARAGLFGNNAPDPRMLKLGYISGITTWPWGNNWANYQIQGGNIDLDGTYPKIVAGGWVVLAGGSGSEGDASLPGEELLVRINSVRQLSRSAYGLSQRLTRLKGDVNPDPAHFALPDTLVLAQSEELRLAPRYLPYPAYGAELALDRRVADLEPRQPLALSGKRQRLRIVADDPALKFVPDGGTAVATRPGDSFVVLAPPVWLLSPWELALPPWLLEVFLRFKPGLTLRWRLADRSGAEGVLDGSPFSVALEPARKDDPVVSELRHVAKPANAVAHTRDRTVLQLDAAMAHVYDRTTLTVCANLAPATHGERVGEIAGSGDAALPGQRFVLKQSPLTYVSAATPAGRASTLEVRVDGQLWNEVPSLFGRGPREHVYALRQDDEQRTIVQFGDNQEGARLSSGQDNVRLSYRKGLGVEGNVRSGQLTTLLGRPLGVKAACNPVAATGGQDPESRDEARRNAPLTMLTLGRAVSVQDYTDFARSFAGVAKACAIWLKSGPARGIHLTIAGPNGDAIVAGSATHQHLTEALRRYGDPLIPLRITSYAPVRFRIRARIKVDAAFVVEDVLKAARQRLHSHFAFDQRDFLQQVAIDEVMAVIQNVSGVEAVDVDELYRLDPGATPDLVARLFAKPPQLQPDGSVAPAELVTLDSDQLALEVMP